MAIVHLFFMIILFYFFARMCKWVDNSVAVQSLLTIVILALSQSLFVCVSGMMDPSISEDVVYIFVVNKRGLHLQVFYRNAVPMLFSS